MNNSLETIYKAYKPLRITKKNSVIIMYTMDGDYVIKPNPKIDYNELYNYLSSRSFNYYPKLIETNRDNTAIFQYEEDIALDNNQKALDLSSLLALLHTKTSYFKEVTNDKYKEVYENLKNNITYISNYYNNLYDSFIIEKYYQPSHYLLLKNYTLIANATKYSEDTLDKWYKGVTDNNRQRVALLHNNIKLDHFLKNQKEYLISWDNYIVDSPVLDLYNFYKNDWDKASFIDIFAKYNEEFPLLNEEKILLDVLISIPYKVEFTENELNNCRNIRKLIQYLNKSGKIVFKEDN